MLVGRHVSRAGDGKLCRRDKRNVYRGVKGLPALLFVVNPEPTACVS